MIMHDLTNYVGFCLADARATSDSHSKESRYDTLPTLLLATRELRPLPSLVAAVRAKVLFVALMLVLVLS